MTSFRNTFTIEVDYDMPPGYQFDYQITDAIDNPLSERPSDYFVLLTSEAELENSSEYLRITATRGSIIRTILTPES